MTRIAKLLHIFIDKKPQLLLWKANGLRHAYAMHRIPFVGHALTAAEMGTNERICDEMEATARKPRWNLASRTGSNPGGTSWSKCMSVRFNRVMRADVPVLGKHIGSRDLHGFTRKAVTNCHDSTRVDTFAARSCGLVMKEKNTKTEAPADFRAVFITKWWPRQRPATDDGGTTFPLNPLLWGNIARLFTQTSM